MILGLPLLDHHERVRTIVRGAHRLDIDRRAVLDAARLREHRGPVGGEVLQHLAALARLGGDDGDDVDHEFPPRFLNCTTEVTRGGCETGAPFWGPRQFSRTAFVFARSDANTSTGIPAIAITKA